METPLVPKHLIDRVGFRHHSASSRSRHVAPDRGTDVHGDPIIYSRNHNRRWGLGVYPKGRVIAYVMP